MQTTTLKRAGLALALSLCMASGASAAALQFLHEGIVYEASGNKLKVLNPADSKPSKPITPENGDLPEGYSGDIVLPETITYNGVEYTVTSVAKGFKGQPITSLVMPNTVTEATAGAFDGCGELVHVTISEGFTKFPGNMFQNCVKLEEINIPANVSDIPTAFAKGCVSLKKITIADGPTPIALKAAALSEGGTSNLKELYIYRAINLEKVEAMADKPFRGAANLEKVVLGGTCTKLNASYFENCSSLNSIVFESTMTEFGTSCFAGTALTSFTFPDAITEIPSLILANTKKMETVTMGDGVTNIAALAFQNSGMKQFNMPSALTTIGDMAFSGCVNLSGTLTLGANVKRIGEQAFAGAGYSDVVIPAATTAIGDGAFFKALNIASYNVDAANTTFTTGGAASASLVNTATNTLVAYAPKATATTVDIAQENIAPYAMYNAANLTKINAPNAINFGDRCFEGTNVTEMTLKGTIGRYVMANCPALTTLTIDNAQVPFGVASGCTALTTVNLPSTLTVVKQDAFAGCTALKSLNLGSVLAILEADCFKNCGVETITVGATFPAAMADGVFTASSNITVKVPVDLVEAYKTADGWSYLNITGDANIVAGGADMGMPAGLYYAGDDNVLHCVYADGQTDDYEVGGIPHTFQLCEYSNRIYGACAGKKFVYSATGDTDGDGKLFYISKVGGNIFQAVVLDNTGNNAYKDPFGLYLYEGNLYVNDRNVAIRIIPASAIALPQNYPSWVENNWMYFYGNPWSYGCIKNGFAITTVQDAEGNPEPLYWVGMKYNGEGIFRWRNANVGTGSAEGAKGTKPVEEPLFTSMKPIITTFFVDEAHGHLYFYCELFPLQKDVYKAGLYRVNLTDLDLNPNPSDFSVLEPVLVDGSPVKYEGSATNEHVGISQLAMDKNGEYLYWCYRAPTPDEAAAQEAQTEEEAAKGKYFWADKYDENNPLHHSGIKRIKLGEEQPVVEMVAPGVSGYGVAEVNYAGSTKPAGVKDIVVPEADLVAYANGTVVANEDLTLTVYNATGLMTARMHLAAGEQYELNLENGVYILDIRAAGATQTLKVVK